MGQSINTYNWTTLDELEFVRHIFNGQSHIPNRNFGPLPVERRIVLLRRYIRCAQCRSWCGVGICVNPQVVILEAMQYLDVLTTNSLRRRQVVN